jgi:hypothetical protein
MTEEWDDIEPDILDEEPEAIEPFLENQEWFADDLTINDCLNAGADGVAISNSHYHALPGISGSNVELLQESNRTLDHKHLFNLGSSQALLMGTFFHCAVLEPDELDKRYTVCPLFDNRTKAGKISRLEFHANNLNKIVVTNDDSRRIKAMARNVRAVYGEVLDSGHRERSYFVDVGGIILKSRPDSYNPKTGHDIDIKAISLGTKSFTNAVLEAHIKKFNYQLSAALRLMVRRALGQVEGNSYLLFCDTGLGHRVRLIQIAPDWLEEAVAIIEDLLEGRRFYLESGVDIPVTVIDDSRRQIL